MRVTLWGTRGSLPSPGPETTRYGGNTSCVEVRLDDGSVLVLDAGSGVRRLGATIEPDLARLDILLTHLHMDHILGLGFFEPLFRPDLEVHLWGTASITHDLRKRLSRYLSPPLFPVHLQELPCRLTLHDAAAEGRFRIGAAEVTAATVCHPGHVVGYRISADGATLAYIPDHEPALGAADFPGPASWTSGYALAADADLLIHDAQYTDEEYAGRVGWGHSAISHTLAFARLARVKELVPFHHDPDHSDADLDHLYQRIRAGETLPFTLTPAVEGATFELARRPRPAP